MSITTPDQNACERLQAEDFHFTRNAWIAAAPSKVYDLVSDVSMISAWSPSASQVSYDEGAGPQAGSWFSGRNERGGKEWTSRSQVLRAQPGEEFAFVVDGLVQWTWTFQPLGTGTVVQQSWQLLGLDPVLGSTRTDLEALLAHMADSVETTLVSFARWVTEENRTR
ncbi:SRPBCC family protein [Streptomyces sp. NPDC059161]|uniref:SRPBCC family protein n=1 Tax=Streptomyces sp. NPDC059161 TaxID=3346749 RepID=UPI003694774F